MRLLKLNHLTRLLLLLLALAPMGSSAIEPVRGQPGPVITGVDISADMRVSHEPPPHDFFYLWKQASILNDATRAEYLTRWRAFVVKNATCAKEGKPHWFMSLAAMTATSTLKRDNAAVLERLVLEDSPCAVRAMQEMLLEPYSPLIDLYLLQPSHHTVEELDAALRTVLHLPAFKAFSREYQRKYLEHQRHVEQERAFREAQAARERQLYWDTLQDRNFYTSSTGGYWQRWNELAAKLDCDHPEMVSYLLNAAAANADIEAIRAAGRRLIEPLALKQPACVLRGMKELRHTEAFIEHYLLASPRVEEIHAAFAGVPDNGNNARSYYEHLYGRYRYRIADPVTDSKEFLWSVKTFASDRAGRIFVPSTYIKGDEEFLDRLNALWEATPEGTLRDHRDRPIKLLPRTALDFMTRGRFGTYYLLDIGATGVEVVKARVVGTALSRWNCGDVASLLVLEPESRPQWLFQSGDYPQHRIAFELRDDLPQPRLEQLEWPDDRHFYNGMLQWTPDTRRFAFEFSDAYVGINFNLTELTTAKRHNLREFASCH